MENPIQLNDANDVNDDRDDDGEVGGHSSIPKSVNDTAEPESSALLHVDREVHNNAVGAAQQCFRHCQHIHTPSSSSSSQLHIRAGNQTHTEMILETYLLTKDPFVTRNLQQLWIGDDIPTKTVIDLCQLFGTTLEDVTLSFVERNLSHDLSRQLYQALSGLTALKTIHLTVRCRAYLEPILEALQPMRLVKIDIFCSSPSCVDDTSVSHSSILSKIAQLQSKEVILMIHDMDMTLLFPALRENSAIQRLALHMCKVGPIDEHWLSLPKNSAVQELNLDYSSCSGEPTFLLLFDNLHSVTIGREAFLQNARPLLESSLDDNNNNNHNNIVKRILDSNPNLVQLTLTKAIASTHPSLGYVQNICGGLKGHTTLKTLELPVTRGLALLGDTLKECQGSLVNLCIRLMGSDETSYRIWNDPEFVDNFLQEEMMPFLDSMADWKTIQRFDLSFSDCYYRANPGAFLDQPVVLNTIVSSLKQNHILCHFHISPRLILHQSTIDCYMLWNRYRIYSIRHHWDVLDGLWSIILAQAAAVSGSNPTVLYHFLTSRLDLIRQNVPQPLS